MSSFDIAAALNLPELSSYIARVEQKLEGVLTTDNSYLQEPIDRLLTSRGKQLRPSLLIAVVASQGKNIDERVISSCVAVELIHIASLVHDDVIDNATSRRNVPTINHQADVNRAIIVGDYLVARAITQAASVSQEVAQTIASAFAAMCDGQARELADIGNLNRTQASYLQAISGKTAALFSAACQIGGLCAKLPNVQIKALASYGENFGRSYQLLDDVLDFIADSKLFGKPVGTDLREGNYTLPLLLGLADSHNKELKKILINKTGLVNSRLNELLTKDGSFEKTIAKAQEYNHVAIQPLESFESNPTMLALKALPAAYLQWSLQLSAKPERVRGLS